MTESARAERVRDERSAVTGVARLGRQEAAQEGLATIDTTALFAGGGTEVRLVHRGQEYRLRITRLGKLILTK